LSGGFSVKRGRDGPRDTIGRYLAGVVLKVRVDLAAVVEFSVNDRKGLAF
jgi:hypothetical protein